MTNEQRTLSLTVPIYTRLRALRDALTIRKGRQVTYQEVIQDLLDLADREQVTP